MIWDRVRRHEEEGGWWMQEGQEDVYNSRTRGYRDRLLKTNDCLREKSVGGSDANK
jgi:hypothetical protein